MPEEAKVRVFAAAAVGMRALLHPLVFVFRHFHVEVKNVYED